MSDELKILLAKSIKKAGISQQVEDAQILKYFNEIKDSILSNEEAKKVRSMYINDNILNVASLSDIAIQKLKLSENEIIGKINEKTDVKRIIRIRYIS